MKQIGGRPPKNGLSQGEVRVVGEFLSVGASRPQPLAGGEPPRPPVGDVGTKHHDILANEGNLVHIWYILNLHWSLTG